jgi:hypothetical protein
MLPSRRVPIWAGCSERQIHPARSSVVVLTDTECHSNRCLPTRTGACPAIRRRQPIPRFREGKPAMNLGVETTQAAF